MSLERSSALRSVRLLSVFTFFFVALTQIPAVSAHGATATGGLSQRHGIVLALIGIVILGGATILKRRQAITSTTALIGVFLGIVVTALGAILFEGLSPDPSYMASSMPFPRSWYPLLSLSIGFLIMIMSALVGWFRWPTRPRYTALGTMMGLWITYPYLIPGPASYSHPLGYSIVLGTPVLVGYIIWKDAGHVLRAVLQDRVARRFGIGVGVVIAFFFVSATGYISFFPDEGLPHERVITVLPAIYQLVKWPVLEVYLPHIPLFVAISPGQLIIVGMLSTLIGLNATLIARHWRVEERAGMTEGAAGSAAIVGSCTCGCCGPLVAKIAVLAAGPSIAAPLYWIFVDSASPLSTLFIIASIVLFTGSLIYSVESVQQSASPTDIAPAD
ncbi:hypothetical protein [Haloarcula nitratireducens]|uniref:Uncharacterized protein n=1 Tax=Haloarcula nitratireducens TaxID=2487749 RepID=A0AAW4PI15_9EURY|nr:hypothetical protein [Halomicroarcula nitratireducens]MBX0296915.1 hypothetical protein [Halomicroarcula nitratireducens]